MINYRVENLVELLAELKSKGVTILDEIEIPMSKERHTGA